MGRRSSGACLARRADAGGADRRGIPGTSGSSCRPTRSSITSRAGAAAATRPWPATIPIPSSTRSSICPPVTRHVVHHRRHTLACPRCRALTTAEPVPEAARGFGPRLQAAAAYLSGRRPARQAADPPTLRRPPRHPDLDRSISKLESRTGLALRSIHAEALDHTRGLDANVDETGWKQGRQKAWLWVAVTNSVTAFLIRRHRDRGAFDDLVGPTPGVLTTDRYPVYTHLEVDKRQVCWAHLRRDFQAMIDRRDGGSAIGEELLMHADILAETWPRVRDGTHTRGWFRREILPWLREEVDALLRAGSRCGGARTAGVCRQLLSIESSLWTFASTSGVEPTNNAAERAVRHAVCWRKTSYGTDSERGSRYVERILTVVASCRSQGRDVLDFLTQAITAHQKPVPEAVAPAQWGGERLRNSCYRYCRCR